MSIRLSAVLVALIAAAPLASAQPTGGTATATADVRLSINAEVGAKGTGRAAAGDAAYAAGNFEAALALYGEGFAASRDSAFIYAQARCHQALGHKDEAKAMFKMYLAASGGANLKYRSDAEAELGVKAKATAGAATGAVGGLVGGAKTAVTSTVGAVADVGAGVYTSTKLTVATSVDASAKAEAQAADTAYAAGKYEDAARGYLAAYATSQQPVALYAAAQAKAQAGHGVEARGLLAGYLAAQPKGGHASDARTLMLAIGGHAKLATKVSVSAKVHASARAQATAGDRAMAAGKFIVAAKAYEEATAASADAAARASSTALLYARGMAQFYAGAAADARTSLKAYLAAGGKLEFKASAQATLRASGDTSAQ